VRAALALALALLGGCVASSQIGPYVKHVARNGDWLVVHKCMIVLEGDALTETACTVEQLPLRSIPQGPPPVGPALAPPPAGTPTAPPGAPTAPPAAPR
jgi:hypothetical protein